MQELLQNRREPMEQELLYLLLSQCYNEVYPTLWTRREYICRNRIGGMFVRSHLAKTAIYTHNYYARKCAIPHFDALRPQLHTGVLSETGGYNDIYATSAIAMRSMCQNVCFLPVSVSKARFSRTLHVYSTAYVTGTDSSSMTQLCLSQPSRLLVTKT